MAELVGNCPRCGATYVTFDCPSLTYRTTEYDWKHWYEAFCVCRQCKRGSIQLVGLKRGTNTQYRKDALAVHNYNGMLNDIVEVKRPITLRDALTHEGPEFLPDDVQSIYKEAVSCLAIECYNAASTMFRLCIDLATRPMLPAANDMTGADYPSSKERRELGLRLKWMFKHGLLPNTLETLSDAVREDANDGAHRGTLMRADAEDLLDFCDALLERMITEPEKLRRAKERRAQRRNPDGV